MAGMAGLEPANAGVKVPCLTTWLHPNIAGSKAKGRSGRSGPSALSLYGVDDGTRTRDTRNHNPMLYQLNYIHHGFATPGVWAIRKHTSGMFPGQNTDFLIFGTPEGTRTPDPLLRRQLLYPPELRAPESSGLSEALLEYHTMQKAKSQGFAKSFSFPPMVLPQRICYTDSKRGAAAHFAARPGKEVLNQCRTFGMT